MNENVSFLTLLHDNVPLSYMFKRLARVMEFLLVAVQFQVKLKDNIINKFIPYGYSF